MSDAVKRVEEFVDWLGVDADENILQLDGHVLNNGDLRAIIEENKRLKEATEKELSDRMVAAGMVPLDEITDTKWMGKFATHAGVTDLSKFEQWVARKDKEYSTMNAAHQCGAHKLSEDIFDYILGKASAFGEVQANLGQALGKHPASVKG